jgi:glycine betaine/proline transport system ATP-binding protein
MDEAFSALDPLIRSGMQELLLQLQTELKKTILFVTHDLDEAIRIGEKIAILRDGMIVQNDTSQGIVLNPADDYIADFTRGINRGRVIKVGSILTNTRTNPDLPKCSPDACLEDGLSAAIEAPDGRLLITDDHGNNFGILTTSEIVEAMQVK